LSEMPPENIAPWKEPNNKMKKIIGMRVQGRLASMIQTVQENIAKQHLVKLTRRSNPSPPKQ